MMSNAAPGTTRPPARRARPTALLAATLAMLAAAPRVEAQRTVVRVWAEADSAQHERLVAQRQLLLRRIDSLRRELRGGGELAPDSRRQLEDEMANAYLSLARLGVMLLPEGTTRAMFDSLRPALGEVQRALVEMRRAADARGVLRQRTPRGWIGITVAGEAEARISGDELLVRFPAHPPVVSVDQGSPAERAGIRRGDTLVAYNGRDVRRELPMRQLLRPGARLAVRVRRDGESRDVTLRVAPAPDLVIDRRMDLAFPRAPLSPGEHARLGEPPRAWAWSEPRAPRPPSEPSAMARVLVVPSIDGDVVAGALLEPLDDDLGAVDGARRGLLVLRALPGSPASEVGLARGDVIVAAAGQPLTDVATFRRLVAAARGEIELQVVRKGAWRKVVLK